MAFTELTYPFGSLLTSTKMTQNQTNFTAIAAGDTGAPIINYSNIFDAAEYTIISSAFTTVSKGYIYMLGNVDQAEFKFDLKNTTGVATAYARLLIGGLSSDIQTETTAAFVPKTSIVSLSTLVGSGWVSAEIQLRNANGTLDTDIRGTSIRLY